jgi:GTP-binding protein HflX
VVDFSSDSRNEQVSQVNTVLAEIGAQEVPQVIVLNQIDRLGLEAGLERDEYGRISKVRISARTGEGLPLVRQAMLEHQQRLTEAALKLQEKMTGQIINSDIAAEVLI